MSADLRGACLGGADFRGAGLGGTKLGSADLNGADLQPDGYADGVIIETIVDSILFIGLLGAEVIQVR